ncbi:MAG: hypothetical protein KZQ83_08070 [gamma proteobacterium symbiont of Taylorina sp.]|nr:hypothetical protein [gamma proteobacterium symbiont of Taylorina sp.]
MPNNNQKSELATKSDIELLQRDIKESEAKIMGELKLNHWMLVLIVAVTVVPLLKALFS